MSSVEASQDSTLCTASTIAPAVVPSSIRYIPHKCPSSNSTPLCKAVTTKTMLVFLLPSSSRCAHVHAQVKKGKVDRSIFDGSTINTPSMLCVEDYIDALRWADTVGGLPGLIKRSEVRLNVCFHNSASHRRTARNRWNDPMGDDRRPSRSCVRD